MKTPKDVRIVPVVDDSCRLAAKQLSDLTEQMAATMHRSPLARLEQGLAEARAIIERGRQRIAEGVYLDPYPGAFGYLEATVASYLSEMEGKR